MQAQSPPHIPQSCIFHASCNTESEPDQDEITNETSTQKLCVQFLSKYPIQVCEYLKLGRCLGSTMTARVRFYRRKKKLNVSCCFEIILVYGTFSLLSGEDNGPNLRSVVNLFECKIISFHCHRRSAAIVWERIIILILTCSSTSLFLLFFDCLQFSQNIFVANIHYLCILSSRMKT